MPRRIATLIAAGWLALSAAGCASPGSSEGGQPPAPEAAVTLEVSDVISVRPGSTPTTVLIDASVPSGDGDCRHDLRAEQFDEEGGAIFVHVLFDAPAGAGLPGCGGTAIATVTFTAAEPVGDKRLVIDEHSWTLDGPAYRRCSDTLGCVPPADHCAAQWYQQARYGLDIPAHSAMSSEYCDQQWMVLTVDVNAAACGAGGRPGCSAPPNVTRYFFRFDAYWRVIASTTSGGCAAVKARVPDFPESICEGLPPTL